MKLLLVVDTSVWLDLAKDHREQPVIGAVEDLIKREQIELVVPRLIQDEFDRNKLRVLKESQRSVQSNFRVVRDAVNRFAKAESKAETLRALNEIDHEVSMKSEATSESVDRIEKLLASATHVETTADIKQRVTERALAGKAPYHRDKNSAADAILIELYADLLASATDETVQCAFVTHNTTDFSQPNGDRRLPHEDFHGLFNSAKSTYWISLVELIKRVDPDLLDEHDFEVNYWQQSRRLSEILEAENLLFKQVWYNRHWNRRVKIENGNIKVVSEENYSRSPYRPDQILDTVWAGALDAAKKTEEEVGLDNLGPWDDFEWGMLNGKLSALRWVLGDDWDMLDT